MADFPPSARILILEDEPVTRRMLSRYLLAEGFSVREAPSCAVARQLAADGPADLALIDLNLPDGDGLTFGQELAAATGIGIIYVTSRVGREDKLKGLASGDDYITKPVDLAELGARVRSVLRRRPPEAGTAPGPKRRILPGGFLLDLGLRRLMDASGTDVRLTRGEFDLLAALADEPGRVLNRDYLALVVGQDETEPNSRTVDVLISRLRRKLGADMIETVHGIGYRTAATPSR